MCAKCSKLSMAASNPPPLILWMHNDIMHFMTLSYFGLLLTSTKYFLAGKNFTFFSTIGSFLLTFLAAIFALLRAPFLLVLSSYQALSAASSGSCSGATLEGNSHLLDIERKLKAIEEKVRESQCGYRISACQAVLVVACRRRARGHLSYMPSRYLSETGGH